MAASRGPGGGFSRPRDPKSKTGWVGGGWPDVDDRRRWWNKSGGRAIDVQAHHVAHVEHSDADLRRGSHRHGGAGGVDGAVANDR
jgi:hypothetical protein